MAVYVAHQSINSGAHPGSFSGREHPCSGRHLLHSVSCSSSRSPLLFLGKATHLVPRPAKTAAAVAEESGEVYPGRFGQWTLDEKDRQEVFAYRVGLTVAATAINLGTAAALLPEDWGLTQLLRGAQEGIAYLGAAGLGVSLLLIHMYVSPIKRFMQVLWAAGLAGAVGISLTQAEPMPAYVVDHPAAVWLVGPVFAALTGLAFKEGACYGKLESALLFFIIPALMLGHLTGLSPPGIERALLVVMATLFSVFAARKYTQAVKDDIGDKSVFEFQALSEEEQQERVRQLSIQSGVGPLDAE